jgi:hypothetical protein
MRTRLARWAGVLAAASLLPLSACDEILSVNNPAEIPIDSLGSAALLDAQLAGLIARFAENIAGDEEGIVQGGTFMTDEEVTGLNWEDWQRENQRIVEYNEGSVDVIWSNQSEIVRLGENLLANLDTLVADPSSDDRVALASALTGYGYVFIGEHFCMAVFSTADSLSTDIEEPDEVFQRAIPHFQRAIDVGTAVGETDIVNLARVGMARAHLNLQNWTQVISFAGAVPSGFVYWVEYISEDSDLYNNLYNEVTGSNHTIGVHPAFLNGTYGDNGLVAGQTDPRIQHTSDFDTGHDGSTKLYKPFQGRRYSGYSGLTIAGGAVEGDDVILFEQDTDVMLADYVEAQHHMYEAMYRAGQPEGPILAFVNARRAVGNEAPDPGLTGAALFAELRRQRSRDHYMGGLRIGDLRRWARQGVGNFFPTGAHPNPERPPAVYGPWTCYPLPIEEYEGNPDLERPADPFTPPGI